jgi:ABC-type multidrug transport system ATPase subunit
MPPLLEAEDLTRAYGPFRALAPTSLVLDPGDLVFLSGPNGAGKSTLLLCLSGLLHPTAGAVRVEGFDLYHDEVEARARLAFVPDVPRFYTELTAWEHLQFVAYAYRCTDGFERRAETLLREFGLWEARDLFPHNYSRGMRLKLGLLMAFIRPLRVLLLDEPTSALDAESEKAVVTALSRLLRGRTALIIAHRFTTLRAANRIAVMEMGRIVEIGSHDELLARGGAYARLHALQFRPGKGAAGQGETP